MVPEPIIKLNVGGEVIQTSIQTLTKYPGSMLCAMFSYTETGKIFKRELDKDIELFILIIVMILNLSKHVQTCQNMLFLSVIPQTLFTSYVFQAFNQQFFLYFFL